jgi:hypothetical protein
MVYKYFEGCNALLNALFLAFSKAWHSLSSLSSLISLFLILFGALLLGNHFLT